MSLEEDNNTTFAIGREVSNSSLESDSSSSPLPTPSTPLPTSRSKLPSSPALRRTKTLAEIRSHAKKHRVTLKDTVESISRSILRICQANEEASVGAYMPKWYDEYYEQTGKDLVRYLWRIVCELNASKEPVMFRHDGQQQQLVDIEADNNSNNSAMGRGLRCLLFSLFYLDRMTSEAAEQRPPFVLTTRNVNLALLGAMYLAHKFSDDAPVRLARFANLGGVSAGTLRRMEVFICQQISFHLFISEDQFEKQSLVQLDKAVRGAAIRVAKIQQQQQQAPEKALANFGLGGSTPIMTMGNTSKRKQLH